jgi:hypothetical protein
VRLLVTGPPAGILTSPRIPRRAPVPSESLALRPGDV